jgi:hypothetical protein
MTEERSNSPHAPGTSPKDWKEHFNDENGCYQCRCIACEAMFYGHKRSTICRECAMTEERIDSPNWKAVAEDVADWIDELCVGTLRSDTKRHHYKPRPEAKFAKSTEERSDSPRPEWVYSPIDGLIYSSNFHHDAALKLTGDFVDDEEKTAYAEKLCALLNGKP